MISYEEMYKYFDAHYQEPAKKSTVEDFLTAFSVAIAMAFLMVGFFL